MEQPEQDGSAPLPDAAAPGEAALGDRETGTARLRVENALLRQQVEEAQRSLQEAIETAERRTRQSTEFLRQLEQAHSETAAIRRTLDGVYRSSSWRLTAPWRWLISKTGRLLWSLRFVVFHARGKPRKLPRRILFHSDRRPRALFHGLVFHPDGRVREAFERWLRPEAPVATLPGSAKFASGLADVVPRREPVDIVICVHNALDDVRRCLASLMRSTLPPYRLILVDDGSGAETANFLTQFARDHGAKLLRHDQAKGYTFAANAGLRSVTAPFCVLLNSDTELTEGWLDRLMEPMRRNDKVGMVGPLSNTASWQSAPLTEEDGDWALNPLPEGKTIDDMARLLADGSRRLPVPLGFLNGFCLLMRQEMVVEVGLFDEEGFGAGYGEENDYCIRARKAGWQLVVAEDCYVYHHQSRSYGNEQRRMLSDRAGRILAAKHSVLEDIEPYIRRCRDSLMLHGARLRLASNLDRESLAERGRVQFEGLRVAFLLPVAAAGGGANVVLDEARAMRRFGVDAWILNYEHYGPGFTQGYPELDLPVLYAGLSPNGMREAITASGIEFDAILATAATSFASLPPATAGGPVLGYYIQDVETRFFEHDEDSKLLDGVRQSYLSRPDVKRMTKSQWNREAIVGLGGIAPTIIGPSVDLDRFAGVSDDGLDPARPVHITAMVRPETPRRNPRMTVRVLQRLRQALGGAAVVSCFGCSLEDLLDLGEDITGIIVHGPLVPADVGALLAEADLFLDLSLWQAMGLTALEAMASGVAVMVPEAGGATEFCVDGVNGLAVDTLDEDACFAAAERLARDLDLRTTLRRGGMETAHRFPPERAALHLLQGLFSS